MLLQMSSIEYCLLSAYDLVMRKSDLKACLPQGRLDLLFNFSHFTYSTQR